MLSSQVVLRATRAVRLVVPTGMLRVPGLRAFTLSALAMAKTTASAPTTTSTSTTTKKTAAAKPKSSSAAAKASSKPAASASRQTKTKTTKAKSAAKKPAVKARKRTVKAKVKKPVKKRARLTEEQKQKRENLKMRESFRELVNKALIREEPISGRFNAWNIFVTQRLRSNQGGSSSMIEKFQSAGTDYSQLSAAELEKLQESAEAESAKAKKAYVEWVQKHTPLQIMEANRARLSINRKIANKRTGFAHARRLVGRITDSRQVKRPMQAMSVFYKELGRIEGGLSAYNERWKALGEADKERYARLAEQDRRRFEDEYQKTYGVKYEPRT